MINKFTNHESKNCRMLINNKTAVFYIIMITLTLLLNKEYSQSLLTIS